MERQLAEVHPLTLRERVLDVFDYEVAVMRARKRLAQRYRHSRSAPRSRDSRGLQRA
jgi:hypothetical protein